METFCEAFDGLGLAPGAKPTQTLAVEAWIGVEENEDVAFTVVL